MSGAENRFKDLNESIIQHLGCTSSNWSDACELREISGFGCGVFATRDIDQDEVLFYDRPLMLGPSGNPQEPICCVNCYKILEGDITSYMCPNQCGLMLCKSNTCIENHKNECELFREWQPKNPNQISYRRLKALFVIRGLFLSESQKKFFNLLQKNYAVGKKDIYFTGEFDNFPTDKLIVDELRASSVAIHTNAFMLLYRIVDTVHLNVRGFYPVVCLMNHNCVPNIRRDIDNNFRYKVASSRPIKKGEQIYISYTQLLWGTNSRRLQIMISKQFLCTCPRCLDVNECGTNLSAIRCQNKDCTGFVLPIVPLDFRSDAKCGQCEQMCENKRFLRVHEVVSTMVKNGSATLDFAAVIHFMQTKLAFVVPECSQYVMELKLETIWKHSPTTYEGKFGVAGCVFSQAL